MRHLELCSQFSSCGEQSNMGTIARYACREHEARTEWMSIHDLKVDRSAYPTFDVAIEWENARLSELERARRMLSSLHTQVQALGLSYRPTAYVTYDTNEINPAIIEQAIVEALPPAGNRVLEFDLRGVRGYRYYELKNFAATFCDREVIVFIDSDVVPEEGWLASLLETLCQPSVHVVGGTAYVEPDSFYSRSVALFWFFPLRCEGRGTIHKGYFYANNVAFRRVVFASHPYPSLPQFRGQCVALARSLEANGIAIYSRLDARVQHPPPNGLRHLFLRALAHGHDDVAAARRELAPSGPSALRQVRLCLRRLRATGRRIRCHRREMGMGSVQTVLSLLLAAAYESTRCAGAAYCCYRESGLLRAMRL
jgi:hypothetical protein